ncbi:MAG: response regulator [Dehalococcoidales bacterium]|nr:response regulator [Dehalococcoidales bacterium]
MNDTVNPSGWFDLDENGLYINSQFFVRFLSYYRWSVYSNHKIENNTSQDSYSSQKDTVVMTMTENSGRIIMAISKYPSFISTLHYIFNCRGYSIDAAITDELGLIELVNEIQPNLLINDIMMPSMIGISLALRLRINTEVPTILISNWQTANNNFKSLNVDDPGILSSQISPDELVEWVGNIQKRNKNLNRNRINIQNSPSMTNKSETSYQAFN